MTNISLNTDATVKNAAGDTLNAHDVICDNKLIIILGLEAARAAVKNPVVKGIVGIAINLIEHLVESYCAK